MTSYSKRMYSLTGFDTIRARRTSTPRPGVWAILSSHGRRHEPRQQQHHTAVRRHTRPATGDTQTLRFDVVGYEAANPSDPGDYEIGEKIDNYGTGGSIRYIFNQGHDGFSHSCRDTSTAYIDVHRSSGVGKTPRRGSGSGARIRSR